MAAEAAAHRRRPRKDAPALAEAPPRGTARGVIATKWITLRPSPAAAGWAKVTGAAMRERLR